MNVLTFTTHVSGEGQISIPPLPKLVNQEVEIIIKAKVQSEITARQVQDFTAKWAGCLEGRDPDQAKFDYLFQKYQ